MTNENKNARTRAPKKITTYNLHWCVRAGPQEALIGYTRLGSRLERNFEVLIGASCGMKISDRGIVWKAVFWVPIGTLDRVYPIGVSRGNKKCIKCIVNGIPDRYFVWNENSRSGSRLQRVFGVPIGTSDRVNPIGIKMSGVPIQSSPDRGLFWRGVFGSRSELRLERKKCIINGCILSGLVWDVFWRPDWGFVWNENSRSGAVPIEASFGKLFLGLDRDCVCKGKKCIKCINNTNGYTRSMSRLESHF